MEIYNKVYEDLCKVYASASIPITKSKKTIIDQIKQLEMKRKNINKKKNSAQIQKFGNSLKEIFPVVKSIVDVPLAERNFYKDQCKERKIMIVSSTDKKQTSRNKKNFEDKVRLSRLETESNMTEDQKSRADTILFSDSSCSSDNTADCSADDDLFSTFEQSNLAASTSYFTNKLHNTAEVAAQIGIGDERAAKLLTAFSEDVGLEVVVTQKKLRSQRELARNTKLESLQHNIVCGKCTVLNALLQAIHHANYAFYLTLVVLVKDYTGRHDFYFLAKMVASKTICLR